MKKESITSWFDSHSRFIPQEGLTGHNDENRKFRIDPPIIDYKEIRRSMTEFLPDYTFMSATEAEDSCEAKKKELQANLLVGPNAFKRCVVPVFLPHVPALADTIQLGAVMEIFMEAVVLAYGATKFSKPLEKRIFNNYKKGTLAGQTTVFPNVGQDEVIAAMIKGPQCGLLFTHPLQGYSVNDQRKVAGLTLVREVFSLAGIEWPLAWIGHTKILGRDFQTPGTDVSALVWQFKYSFCFKAFATFASFYDFSDLGSTPDNFSGGLFCLAGSGGTGA